MARVRQQLDREAQAFGIEVVDVRIRHADLPDQNSQAVYQRMQTERQREAAELRGQGSQRNQEIRARADRDVTVLIAEAQSKAEQSLHLAGAAAALRQQLGVPLLPSEQHRLEKALEFARRTVGNAAGLTAWMEGWAMPVEQAVREVLNCDAESGVRTRDSS